MVLENLLLPFLRGEIRSGRALGVAVLGVGVLEKNPRRVFWPLAEPDFLSVAGAGVLDGAPFLGAMSGAQYQCTVVEHEILSSRQ